MLLPVLTTHTSLMPFTLRTRVMHPVPWDTFTVTLQTVGCPAACSLAPCTIKEQLITYIWITYLLYSLLTLKFLRTRTVTGSLFCFILHFVHYFMYRRMLSTNKPGTVFFISKKVGILSYSALHSKDSKSLIFSFGSPICL